MPYTFSRTLLFTIAGPLVWASHFVFVYALHGVICTRSALQHNWLGFSAYSWVSASASLLALAVMTLAYVRLRKYRPQLGNREFIIWLAGALSLLSGIAIIWETVPLLFLPVCG